MKKLINLWPSYITGKLAFLKFLGKMQLNLIKNLTNIKTKLDGDP